jgi:hypothetical protein
MQRQHCTPDSKFSTAKYNFGILIAILLKIERSSEIGFATVAKVRHLLETP